MPLAAAAAQYQHRFTSQDRTYAKRLTGIAEIMAKKPLHKKRLHW
jgi:hypothetical protein